MLQKHIIQCGTATLILLASFLFLTESWSDISNYIAHNHYISNLNSDYFNNAPSDEQLALRMLFLPIMIGAAVTCVTLLLTRSAEPLAGLHWKKFANKTTDKNYINNTAKNLFLIYKAQIVLIYLIGLIATIISSPLTPLYELNQATILTGLFIILAGHACISRKYIKSLVASYNNPSNVNKLTKQLFAHSETQFYFEGDLLFIIEHRNPNNTSPIKKLAIVGDEEIRSISS